MKFALKIKNIKIFLNKYPAFCCTLLSFFINTIIESLARGSVLAGFEHLVSYPLYFLYNVVLILLTYCLAFLCNRRFFSLIFVTVLWLAAGITNSVLMYFRNTPFIAADFFIAKAAFDIMDVYLSKFQIVSIVGIFVLFLAGLVILFIKERQKEVNYKKVLASIIIAFIISALPTNFILKEKYQNPDSTISEDAEKFGFVCCFVNSIFNSGINKPEDYADNEIATILKTITNDKSPRIKPNIILIQLESFIDPYLLDGVTLNADPIPNFRKMKDEGTSGILNVPVFGGGTANTEFEVLTGMSLKFFGIGEYPYETILQEKAIESACYDLKEIGYTAHAIHNHTGIFYDRDVIYKNLGFDTFTPIEYMNNIKKNEIGWARSGVFTEYIFDALNYTEDKDFIFTVTSQAHGRYPKRHNTKGIKVTSTGSLSNTKAELEYYVNEIHNEDKWLGELLEKLSEFKEPVMVIAYGDHMPSLEMSQEVIDAQNIYKTEYAIWTNYQSEQKDHELYTYTLLAYALDLAEIHTGIFTQLHQYHMKNGLVYEDILQKFQYDMINGEHYLFNQADELPYKPSDMKFGTKEIIITDLIKNSKTTAVIGENFTKSSVVYVNGESVNTKFINPQKLTASSKDISDDAIITVSQRAANLKILSTTEPFIVSDEE